MISGDVQRAIGGHFKEGEKLLWAEKVDDDLRREWLNKSVRDSKILAFPIFLIGVFIIWIPISIDRHPDAEPWIIVLSSTFLIIIGCLFLVASLLSLRSFFGAAHYEGQRPFAYYALTNFRLLYLDESKKIVTELSAIKVKSAALFKRWYFPNKWKVLCLTLSPIGEGIWKMSEIYFLPDFEKSKENILSVINMKD